MKINKTHFFSGLLLLIISSCITSPDEFISPIWDMNLNIPLVHKSYTLNDVVKEDSIHLVISDDPSSLGVLVYTDQKIIEPVTFPNHFDLPDSTQQFSQVMSSIKINDIQPVSTSIALADWNPALAGVTSIIFPEYQSSVNLGFPPIQAFSSVLLESGVIQLNIVNRLPIEIQIRSLTFRNSSDQSIVFDQPSDPANWMSIQAFSSYNVNLNILNKVVSNSLELTTEMYTSGSNGNIVALNNNSGVDLNVGFSNLVISEVSAPIPAQDPIVVSNYFVLDDSTFIKRAKFNSGSIVLSIDNHFDLDFNAHLNITELKDNYGNNFSRDISIGRNQKDVLISIDDLSGWTYENIGTSNRFSFDFTVNNSATNDVRTIRKGDSISVSLQASNISLGSIQGKFKPTSVNIDPISFSLDINSINQKFSYNDIRFNNPDIIMSVSSSALMQMIYTGTVTAENSSQSYSMIVNDILINSSGFTSIDLKNYGLEDLLNSFNNELPERFTFAGTAIINPNYLDGEVHNIDTINSKIDVEIPLDVGISGGFFSDTLDMNFNQIDSTDIQNFENGKLYLKFVNSIPVGVSVSGEFKDSLGTKLLDLPPSGDDAVTKILLTAPKVDDQGNVSESAVTNQTIELAKSQVEQLIKSDKLLITFEIVTSNNGSTLPVRFKASAPIEVSIYSNLKYRLNPGK